MIQIFFGSLLGAFCSLDNSLLANIMISRPVFLGPILGLLFGNVTLGFEIGFLFEFLFADMLYVGNFVPINISLLITLVLGSVYFLPYSGDALIMFVILISIIVSYIFKNIEIGFRTLNSVIANEIENFLEGGKFWIVYIGIFYSIISFFILNFVLLFGGIFLTSEITKLVFLKLPYNVILALKMLYNFLPILAFSILLNIFLAGDLSTWIKKKFKVFNKSFKKESCECKCEKK
jgi:mannose/fructose/N-acetylgalactosamine-specific phosphotransferase system component IIC